MTDDAATTPTPDARDREPTAPPQSEAGIDRAGTRHAAPPNQSEAGRPDAPAPSSQRPVDQEGPVEADGSERAPDPRVSTVPLEGDDGEEVVIQQQNVGPGNQVGAGEFKEPGTASSHKDPGEADRQQRELDHDTPIDAQDEVRQDDGR